ncbi:MAG TPA: hypothetical protein VD902_10250 [Symbiobacteriaceae bacterium]|nr:hypothetical protein [Symbiobacteriaceae bacterium]
MAKSDAGSGRVKVNTQQQALPKEVVIPEDFEGVIQVNIQSQRETETESIAQSQATGVSVHQTQAQQQLTNVQIAIQQMQSQQQSIGTSLAQMQGQLQALQSQMQLLFLAVLGTPSGSPEGAAERRQMLGQIVEALRPSGQ